MLFGNKEPTDCHFIPTDWLRCWATGELPPGYKPIKLLPNSDVIDVDIKTNGTIDAKADEPAPAGLPGTSECNNLQLCCQEHGGMGLHPRTLHKCKILSPETYEKLNKAVREETGNPEHSFENFSIKKANFRCLECEKNYKRTLTETIAAAKKWHGLIATLNSPEANIKHPENLDVGETNVVASSFISAITSNFNRICAACIKDPATLEPSKFSPEGVSDSNQPPEETAGFDDSEVASIFKKKSPAKDRKFIDPTVNGSIMCEHGKFGNPGKKQFKLVTRKVWDSINTFFPCAVKLLPNDVCPKCQTTKESNTATKSVAHQWYEEIVRSQSLKDLAKIDRKKKGFPAPPAFKSGKFHVVEREGVERWRGLVTQAKSGKIDLEIGKGDLADILDTFRRSDEVSKEGTECKHGKSIVPKLIRDAIEGKEIKDMFSKYGQALDGGGTIKEHAKLEEGKSVLISEVLTDEEFQELNGSLSSYDQSRKSLLGISEDAGVDALPSLKSLNSFTISSPPSDEVRVNFALEICQECMKEIHEKNMQSRRVFSNKTIKVIELAQNHSVPGKMAGVRDGTTTVGEGGIDLTVEDDDETGKQTIPPNPVNGGLLGSVPATSPEIVPTRRSSRQQSTLKGKDIMVDSTDLLGKLRLKLLQECDLSPFGQHLYMNGVELLPEKNMETIGSLNVLAGSILYVQMDKRDMTREGRERYDDEEEAVISNLLSCCSGGDMINVGGRGRTVERGFGGSWLSGGGGGTGDIEIDLVGSSNDQAIDLVEETSSPFKARKSRGGRDDDVIVLDMENEGGKLPLSPEF